MWPIEEIIDWGTQDYFSQIAMTDTYQTVIPREDFEAGVRTSEALSLGDITGTRVSLYIGAADELCTVGAAKRILDEIGTNQKSLTIVEYIDPEAEPDELVKMGHIEWGFPLADKNLNRLKNTLLDSASYLTAMGALSVATISAIALF